MIDYCTPYSSACVLVKKRAVDCARPASESGSLSLS
jgi:hypothetical protein